MHRCSPCRKNPDLFKAGASFAGVTDLPTLLDNATHYYGQIANLEQLIGDRWSDRKRLRAASPARAVDLIRAPVFIAHGTEDPVVQVDHAERMAAALTDAGREVETYIYEGEVHGFIDERNEIDFHTRLAAFFTRHLKTKGANPAPRN